MRAEIEFGVCFDLVSKFKDLERKNYKNFEELELMCN